MLSFSESDKADAFPSIISSLRPSLKKNKDGTRYEKNRQRFGPPLFQPPFCWCWGGLLLDTRLLLNSSKTELEYTYRRALRTT